MSENDPRFGYPIEFVKEHVLGCFEASKACALLPGKPHLYHVEFLKREDSTEIKNGSALPLDFYLQAHFSPCDEVSWYLHTRKDFATYEGSEKADEQYVLENEQGVIPPLQTIPELTETEKATYIFDAMQAHTGRISSLIPHTCGCLGQLERQNAREAAQDSVPITPENLQDSQTVTDGYGQGRKAKSRYDRIKAELEKNRAS